MRRRIIDQIRRLHGFHGTWRYDPRTREYTARDGAKIYARSHLPYGEDDEALARVSWYLLLPGAPDVIELYGLDLVSVL